MAKAAEVSLNYVARLERGLRTPSLDVLLQFAKGLRTTGSDVLAGIEEILRCGTP